jgi:hypothetical protein
MHEVGAPGSEPQAPIAARVLTHASNRCAEGQLLEHLAANHSLTGHPDYPTTRDHVCG